MKKLVEEITKIPIGEGLDLKNIKINLNSRIIGQEEAIDELVKTLMLNKLNLDDGDKPIGSFMFVGYSGVGKTQLTKELASNIFGSSKSLVRFDCSEYTQSHEVSKLIGAPVGYVGYKEGGLLTEAIKRQPFSVILFDEIEKAHNKLFDVLLQVLGEGRLTDNQGTVVDFKNTIVVLTSNIGTKRATIQKVGFINNKKYNNNEILKSISNRFRPEFINRLDNIIHFNILSKENLKLILDIELTKLQTQVEKHGYCLKISNKVKLLLVEEANIPEKGVRALKRKINSSIKNIVAEKLIELIDTGVKGSISLVIKKGVVAVK